MSEERIAEALERQNRLLEERNEALEKQNEHLRTLAGAALLYLSDAEGGLPYDQTPEAILDDARFHGDPDSHTSL